MPAYSVDLRERIVTFFDEGHTMKDTVETFKVSVSCLRALLRLRDKGGGLSPRPPAGGHPSVLRPEDLVTLRRLVEEQPDAYLRELADRLAEAGGPRVRPAAICKRLKKLELTRKKKDLHAAEQDTDEVQEQREAFREEISAIDPGKLIFLDETGVNLGMTRHFARSPEGTRAHGSAPINLGPNISIVAGIRLLDGICAAMTIEGAFDGEAFMTFINEVLVPALLPDDHVVLDNLGAHRVPGVVTAIEAAGAHVHFLPPYSPDFNPIEHFWSTFKEALRAVAARTKEALDAAVARGLDATNSSQVHGWFKGCGYV